MHYRIPLIQVPFFFLYTCSNSTFLLIIAHSMAHNWCCPIYLNQKYPASDIISILLNTFSMVSAFIYAKLINLSSFAAGCSLFIISNTLHIKLRLLVVLCIVIFYSIFIWFRHKGRQMTVKLSSTYGTTEPQNNWFEVRIFSRIVALSLEANNIKHINCVRCECDILNKQKTEHHRNNDCYRLIRNVKTVCVCVTRFSVDWCE